MVNEVNRAEKLAKFLGLGDEIQSADKVYEYISRYNSTQYSNIINSILKLNNTKEACSMDKNSLIYR